MVVFGVCTRGAFVRVDIKSTVDFLLFFLHLLLFLLTYHTLSFVVLMTRVNWHVFLFLLFFRKFNELGTDDAPLQSGAFRNT